MDTTSAEIGARTAANRVLLADFFDGLSDQQLDQPSLCDAWTVREVLGHLVMPFSTSLPGFVWQVVRAHGSVDRASAATARELSRRPVNELTSILRGKAHVTTRAPGVGPMGQMADGCIHLRDCARPLGLPHDVGLDDWRLLLEWMPRGVPGLVPKRRLTGLRLVATDQGWTWGEGEEVRGRSEALALAVAGRTEALADLSGGGVATLGARLRP